MLRSLLVLIALAAPGCDRPAPAGHVTEPPAAAAIQAEHQPGLGRLARPEESRDLSADEALGGHTLARHVGKTDGELRERLRREPQISTASTYTDRSMAERVVGATLATGGRSFEAWRARKGRRPNFVLHHRASTTIGRSLSRGRSASVPCEHAVVVLRWDDRLDRYYVLTSYPEESR